MRTPPPPKSWISQWTMRLFLQPAENHTPYSPRWAISQFSMPTRSAPRANTAAREEVGRLAVELLPPVVERPVGVLQRQAAEQDIVNQATFLPRTVELHQSRQHRRNAQCAGHVFARQRIILQPAGFAVEVPLARRIERLADVVDPVALLAFHQPTGHSQDW